MKEAVAVKSGALTGFALLMACTARAPIDENGKYTLMPPGGGAYEIQCGPVCRRRFVASSTRLCKPDIEPQREIAVTTDCPQSVQPGTPFHLRVMDRRLDSGSRDGHHELRLRLHGVVQSQKSR